MKIISPRWFPAAVLSVGFTILPACNKADHAEVRTDIKDAYADVKASASNTWAKIKDYSYDKRSDFTAEAKAASSQLDADISKLRADYSDAQASASRKAAMAELKDADADYHQKLDALSQASADSWDSAKKNAMAAWDRLQAAYDKARAK